MRLRYFGDYELEEEIARGGMGVVYKASQLSLNRTVAVKMILAGQLASPADVQRFRAEAEAAAHLKHANIVAIHEVGEHEGQHYFSMDYIEGRNLAQACANRRAEDSDFQQSARWVKTLADAVHYAHQQGILHRDLKPSNVLIDSRSQPHLTDFGLAKQVQGDSDLTVTGQVLGTPNFMPPEQASAKRDGIGPKSDVYSLGAILYFLLTGRPPFAGETVHNTVTQVLTVDPESPRKINPAVPLDLETIALKCLRKDPRQRYDSASSLADDLGRFLQDLPIQARPIGSTEKLWRWCRRHPAVVSLTLGLAITCAAFLTVLALQSKRARAATDHHVRSRASYQYDGPVPTLYAVDEETLVTTQFGPGQGVAIDPTNNCLWCPILVSNMVLIRDGATGAVITNLTLADCPGETAFDPRRRVAWVSAQCGKNSNTNYPSNDLLWAIDADSYEVIGAGPIHCGGVNGGPSIANPGTGRFYHFVGYNGRDASHENIAQRVDLRTLVPTRFALGMPMTVHPDANLLYGRGLENLLQIIDASPDPEVVLTSVALPFPAEGIFVAVNRTLDCIYVGTPEAEDILVLNARTGQNIETVKISALQGVQLRGLAVDDMRNRLFVIATRANQSYYLIAIQGTDQRVLQLPPNACGPVVNPALDKVYIWAGRSGE